MTDVPTSSPRGRDIVGRLKRTPPYLVLPLVGIAAWEITALLTRGQNAAEPAPAATAGAQPRHRLAPAIPLYMPRTLDQVAASAAPPPTGAAALSAPVMGAPGAGSFASAGGSGGGGGSTGGSNSAATTTPPHKALPLSWRLARLVRHDRHVQAAAPRAASPGPRDGWFSNDPEEARRQLGMDDRKPAEGAGREADRRGDRPPLETGRSAAAPKPFQVEIDGQRVWMGLPAARSSPSWAGGGFGGPQGRGFMAGPAFGRFGGYGFNAYGGRSFGGGGHGGRR